MTTPDDNLARSRRAVRQFASGVAVLTVRNGGMVHGTTVSAVTAVSREPLMIAACLSRGSTFLPMVSQGGRFTVNVLRAQQARLAEWFADPSRPRGIAQFDGVDWEDDLASGAPLIRGVLSSFGCCLIDLIPAGDHQLLLASVISGTAGAGRPLLSFNGGLHDADVRRLARVRAPERAAGGADERYTPVLTYKGDLR